MYTPKILFSVVACIFITGCASKARNIAPSYVSSVMYDRLSCKDLANEWHEAYSRIRMLSGVQNRKSTDDAVATTVAVVLFWPAAFFVGGDGRNAAELARLKGTYLAIRKAWNKNSCQPAFK